MQSNESRLDQVEDNINRLTEAQNTTQTQLNQLTTKVDQVSSKVDQFVFQAQRLFTQQATILERVDGRTESLNALVTRLDRNYEQQKAELKEYKLTTNATLERIDRILDFLVKQQP